MRRRDFVRAAVSVIVAPKLLAGQQTANPLPPPPAPVPWMLGLSAKTPLPQTTVAEGIAEIDLKFFTPQQIATLTRLCDLLLPPLGNKPGAVQAEAPLFLDFLISVSPAARQKLYAGGLDWLDTEAAKSHKTSFAALSAAQADELLKPWLRAWMSDHPPSEAHADFVNIAHADIRRATINSRKWSEAPAAGAQESTPIELYWSPIDADIYSDVLGSHEHPAQVIAAPDATHQMPAYPR